MQKGHSVFKLFIEYSPKDRDIDFPLYYLYVPISMNIWPYWQGRRSIFRIGGAKVRKISKKIGALCTQIRNIKMHAGRAAKLKIVYF